MYVVFLQKFKLHNVYVYTLWGAPEGNAYLSLDENVNNLEADTAQTELIGSPLNTSPVRRLRWTRGKLSNLAQTIILYRDSGFLPFPFRNRSSDNNTMAHIESSYIVPTCTYKLRFIISRMHALHKYMLYYC